MLAEMKCEEAKNSKETKNKRHFYFSSSTRTFYYKVQDNCNTGMI